MEQDEHYLCQVCGLDLMSQEALVKYDFSKCVAIARACVPMTRQGRAERMREITVCSSECGLQWLAKKQQGELDEGDKRVELCWVTGHVIKQNIDFVSDRQLIQGLINQDKCLILRPMDDKGVGV